MPLDLLKDVEGNGSMCPSMSFVLESLRIKVSKKLQQKLVALLGSFSLVRIFPLLFSQACPNNFTFVRDPNIFTHAAASELVMSDFINVFNHTSAMNTALFSDRREMS
jgi:hypothetical protein